MKSLEMDNATSYVRTENSFSEGEAGAMLM